jgi:transposase-like protein
MESGRKFCSSCNSFKDAEGGGIKQGRINRWKCKWCIAKLSPSQYASTPKGDKDGSRNKS